MRSVRIWFKKENEAKFISHLDMNRCFTRAIRRAKLNVWYTEGFNPHLYLNFLSPLPLGQESDGEPLDIRMEDDTENSEIMQKLSAVLPNGISVAAVTNPVSGASEIAMAEYEISAELDSTDEAAEFAKRAEKLVAGGMITAEKSAKKGHKKIIKEINLCEYIKKFNVSCGGETVCISCVLLTGNSSNLNPALLMSALEESLKLSPTLISIRRKKLFKDDYSSFE